MRLWIALLAAALSSAGCVSIVENHAARVATPSPAAATNLGQTNLTGRRAAIVESASRYVGTPYHYGSENSDALDCSALTQKVFAENGISLARTAAEQFKHGKPLWRDEVKPGDLVFFETEEGAGATHVGIYAGEGRFIHAPSAGKAVEVSDMTSAYWHDHFLAGRDYLAE